MYVTACDPDFWVSYADALEEGFRVPPDPAPTGADVEAARTAPDRFFPRLLTPPASVALPSGERVPVPPTTVFWWAEGRNFVGAAQVRHSLTSAFVAAYVGHISFGVRPSATGRGHARAILAAALGEAARLGIKRAFLTARTTNHASLSVIRSAGGIFVDEVPVTYDASGGSLARYVIPTGGR